MCKTSGGKKVNRMNINPIAFSIGPVDVYWYGVLISTGVLLGLFMAMKQARRYGT
jgi:phosphatidylglycerol---prolipoprotein diacylglyceryl transferase